MLEEHALDPALHDRIGFSCGVPELDDYLHRFAVQQRSKGVSAIHVQVDSENPGQILGYYTLSAAQMDVVELSDVDKKKLPRYPVPCFRLGRLACRAEQRGMELEMKILDIVALLDDLPESCLSRGQVGTIVEDWKSGVYEVEFADLDGRTYATAAILENRLMPLCFEPARQVA